jgi:hypothetical protein
VERRRIFILTFAVVGIILIFAQRLASHLLAPYERVDKILRPAAPFSPTRILAANLVGPVLYLAAIAAALWISLGTPAPQWTRRRWPWAILVYFLLHAPLAFFFPFPRWGFLFYFGLSFLGLASALWILSRNFHPAFPLIVLAPVLSEHFYSRFPHSLRFASSALTTVLILALAGWWLHDAANRFPSSVARSSPPQTANPV